MYVCMYVCIQCIPKAMYIYESMCMNESMHKLSLLNKSEVTNVYVMELQVNVTSLLLIILTVLFPFLVMERDSHAGFGATGGRLVACICSWTRTKGECFNHVWTH